MTSEIYNLLNSSVSTKRVCRQIHNAGYYRRDNIHPIAETLFPESDCIFQDYNVPMIIAQLFKNWYVS